MRARLAPDQSRLARQGAVECSSQTLAQYLQSQGTVSIAEIAAHVELPLGVVRVLCSDLIEWGLVITRSPTDRSAREPDLETLQAVLDGLIKY